MVMYSPYRRAPKFPLFADENRSRNLLFAVSMLLVPAFGSLHWLGISGGKEIFIGWILTLLHAFLGYVFVERGFRLEMKASIVLLLGGMAVRFFTALLIIALVIVSIPVSLPVFIGSFMVFFTIALFAEVAYINLRTERLRAARVVIRRRQSWTPDLKFTR